MREILFRGKSIETNEWEYGDLIIPDWKNKYLYEQVMLIKERDSGCEIEVVPETVGQFTGLIDKNGTKIFEGDIVTTKFFGKDFGNVCNFNEYDIFQIIYYQARFCTESIRRRFEMDDRAKYEVIGNIHDNPELLKGGAK